VADSIYERIMNIPSVLVALLAFSSSALAKDEKEVPLESCPASVKAVVQENITRSRGKLDKIEKESADGAEFYDAKITDGNGKRWTLKISPQGAILETKEKAPKEKSGKK
jgi:hypothetical protein